MKPKSALFISATLTAFVLAILAGVISAFNTAQTSPTGNPTQEVMILDTSTQPAPAAEPVQIGPEQAASLAAQFLNQTDVYSVESTSVNNANAYKVVFSSGDIVFVGLDGTIISTEKLQPAVVINVEPTAAPKRNRSNTNGDDNHSDDDHDDDRDDDHNDDHDDGEDD